MPNFVPVVNLLMRSVKTELMQGKKIVTIANTGYLKSKKG